MCEEVRPPFVDSAVTHSQPEHRQRNGQLTLAADDAGAGLVHHATLAHWLPGIALEFFALTADDDEIRLSSPPLL